MNDFTLIDDKEKDDLIVGFMLAQERDKLSHFLNRERYDSILETGDLDDEWRTQITKLRDETVKRLKQVESIITATKPQMPSETRITAARNRLLVKESMV